MDKNFKGFFASALIFSVLASGCSDNNSSQSSISSSSSTATVTSSNTVDDTEGDDEEESSSNSSSQNSSQIVQLSVNSSDYNSDLTDIFSNNDLNPIYSADNEIILNESTVEINGNGSFSNSDIIITDGGTYKISGKLNDGQIIVNSQEKVWLILDNAEIYCSDSSPIYIVNADKTFITLAENSENYLSDGTTYTQQEDNEPDAVIFSKDNLTINGDGTLNITANFNEGITSKDDITITGGTINITSVGNGIKGKDCIAITSAEINITSQADGIKSSNSDETGKGFIFINSGTFNIDSEEDAFQAEQELIIDGGVINIISGGGSESENVKEHTDDMMMMGGGHGFTKTFGTQTNIETNTTTDTTTEETVSRKGLKAGITLYINGGNITADCSDNAVHSNGDVYISGGNLSLSSGDKAIHADSKSDISDGKIEILTSFEGIEAADIEISGGEISIYASDDGLNASDGSAQMMAADVKLTISGGNLYVNADGDGLDSNNAIYMEGGTVIVEGPTDNANGSLDVETEIYVNGGTLIAVGSSGMAEYPSETSNQQFLAMTVNTQSADSTLKICDSNGNEIINYTPSKVYSSIIISTPELSADETYSLYINETETGTYQTNSIPSGGMMMGGGGRGDFNREDMTPPEGFNGEMPEGFNGEMPELPEGFNDEMPEPPEGFNGEIPELPEGFNGENSIA